MPSCRGLSFNQTCSHHMPVPTAGDAGVPLPVAIVKAVGAGGANAALDVRTIQAALNEVPPAQGGPAVKLAVDGLVGPKTIAAIRTFQSRQTGVVDGRVDPDKRSIAALNRVLGAAPGGVKQQSTGPVRQQGHNPTNVFFTVTPAHMRRVYLEHVPAAQSCVFTALQTLRGEQAAIRQGKPSSSSGRALINKHFMLDRNPNARADIDMIVAVFEKIMALMARNGALVEETFIAAPGRFSYDRVAHSGVMALALAGGSLLKGKTMTLTAEDGTKFSVGQDKIMILPRYNFTNSEYNASTLIHECAHYVGPLDGHSNTIDDPPSRSSAASEIAKMPVPARPRLAECYSLFAFEAKFGREPSRLSLDLNVPF